MPRVADGVADAASEDFPLGVRLGFHADDRRVRIAAIEDIARRADRAVEQPVRSEGQILPAVHPIGRQLVGEHRWFRGSAAAGDFDEVEHAVVPRDPAVLGDVERAILEGDAIRRGQAGGHRQDLVGLEVLVAVDHGVYGLGARADEHRPVRPERHRARAGHVVGVQRDREPSRHLELTKMLRRRAGHRFGAHHKAPTRGAAAAGLPLGRLGQENAEGSKNSDSQDRNAVHFSLRR